MFNTVDELFAQYDKTIDMVENHPIQGPIQYHLTGEGAVDWFLEINGVDVVAHKGVAENPVSVVECVAADYLALKNGTVTHNELLQSKRMILVKGIQNVLKFSKYML